MHMGLHVRVCELETNTHTDPAAANRKHMHSHRKSARVLGRISVYEINPEKQSMAETFQLITGYKKAI